MGSAVIGRNKSRQKMSLMSIEALREALNGGGSFARDKQKIRKELTKRGVSLEEETDNSESQD